MELWSVLEIIHEVSCYILKEVNSKNSLLVCPRMAFKKNPSLYLVLHTQNMVGNFNPVVSTGF